jgi:hypothetical protein
LKEKSQSANKQKKQEYIIIQYVLGQSKKMARKYSMLQEENECWFHLVVILLTSSGFSHLTCLAWAALQGLRSYSHQLILGAIEACKLLHQCKVPVVVNGLTILMSGLSFTPVTDHFCNGLHGFFNFTVELQWISNLPATFLAAFGFAFVPLFCFSG